MLRCQLSRQAANPLSMLNQLEADENAPRTRVRIVMVDAGLMTELKGAYPPEIPAYLLLGYANDADRFEAHATVFRDFVERVVFDAQP